MQLRSPSPSASVEGESQLAGPEPAPAAFAEGAWRSREGRVALAVSVALHATLLAGLILLIAPASDRRAPPEQTVSVEVLSPQQFAVLTRPNADIPAAPRTAAPEERQPSPNTPPPLQHADTILSGAVGANVRRDLTTLALNTRFEQICGVEAMEQIAKSRHEFSPERTVAYATADVKVIGDLMIADGAAFLSGGRWYGLRFRCETSADHLKVTSFDLATGEPLVGDHGLGSGGED